MKLKKNSLINLFRKKYWKNWEKNLIFFHMQAQFNSLTWRTPQPITLKQARIKDWVIFIFIKKNSAKLDPLVSTKYHLLVHKKCLRMGQNNKISFKNLYKAWFKWKNYWEIMQKYNILYSQAIFGGLWSLFLVKLTNFIFSSPFFTGMYYK